MRNCADVAAAIVKLPRDVTPVFTAIVITPVAVLITEKLNPKLTADHWHSVSIVVPKGIVIVYVVPVALIICVLRLALVSVAAPLIAAGVSALPC